MRMLKYEPYKMGLSPETAANFAKSIADHHIKEDLSDSHDGPISEFDAIVAFYFSQGLSLEMAEAEAEADIRYYGYTQHHSYIQDEPHEVGLSPETADC